MPVKFSVSSLFISKHEYLCFVVSFSILFISLPYSYLLFLPCLFPISFFVSFPAKAFFLHSLLFCTTPFPFLFFCPSISVPKLFFALSLCPIMLSLLLFIFLNLFLSFLLLYFCICNSVFFLLITY